MKRESQSFGYCRVSTPKQSIERQKRNIRSVCPEIPMFEDVFTGTKTEGRKKWESLMRIVQAGDTIYFDSVSRMSRNAEEGFETYKQLMEKGIDLVFLKEPQINTATYKEAMERQVQTVETGDAATDELVTAITQAVNKYMMRLAERQIKLAFEQAEKEVEDLRQRTREGIETARQNGKQIGQQKGKVLNVAKKNKAKPEILKHSKDFGGTLSDEECMKLIGLSRNTYYKYKRELREEGLEE